MQKDSTVENMEDDLEVFMKNKAQVHYCKNRMPEMSSSQDTVTEYEEEINFHMKRQEENRIKLQFTSPQIQFRQREVKWIINVAESLELCRCTVHLALYILDVFMDGHKITEERLKLVTLTSLFLAAKFEERDSNIPKISDFAMFTEEEIRKNDCIVMEYIIMKYMNWRFIPTTAHFAEYYAKYATKSYEVNYVDVSNYEQLQKLARSFVMKFLDEIPKDDRFMHYQPSLLGAACVAAARIHLNLPLKWPELLCQITGYKYSQLLGCVNILLCLNISILTLYTTASHTNCFLVTEAYHTLLAVKGCPLVSVLESRREKGEGESWQDNPLNSSQAMREALGI